MKVRSMTDDTPSAGANGGAAAIAIDEAPRLDQQTLLDAYSRWAPVYDWVFGKVFDAGRRAAVAVINARSVRLLEVGVGTGLTLPSYGPQLTVTGIDLSPEMLAVARKRVAEERLGNVEALIEMDATRLTFPDASFDTVAVMYTITVVPHPDAVMAEVERVLKPGGEALIVSHFASENGLYKTIEGWLTPITKKLGWRPDFPISRILGRPGLETVEVKSLSLLGLFSVARLRRRAD